MKISLRWAWRDWWVGFAWEGGRRRILLMIIPSLCVEVEFRHARCAACGLPSEPGTPNAYRPWRHYKCHPVSGKRS